MSKKKPGARTLAGIPLEDEEQISLFEWADRMLSKYPELEWLHAVHNGLRLTPGMRVKAKRLGTRSGVADVCLPEPRRGFHGLYIEMKRRKGGEMSADQRRFADHVTRRGYLYKCCAGWEAAAAEIQAYLGVAYSRQMDEKELTPGMELVTATEARWGRAVSRQEDAAMRLLHAQQGGSNDAY